MSNWPRIPLTGPVGTAFFVRGTLRAAVNIYGLTELFISDNSGAMWHAAQIRRPNLRPGRFGGGVSVVWGPWIQLPAPVPVPQPTTTEGLYWPWEMAFSVSANADGRLEIFAIGADGNPYHMYQLPPPPNSLSLTGLMSWSSWSPMTPGPGLLDWPAQDDVWFQTVSNYWPQSANLLGSIVVCYFSQLNPNVIYYDYQVPDAAQVGGMGWASVANGQLFSIQLPPSVGGGTGFFLSPDWISLISSAEGLSLLLLVSGNGMKSVQFGAASNLTAASGVWSPWTVVAAPYTYGLGAPYPNGSALTVSASINYLPGGGAAAFFSDSSGSLTVMRQQLILAPGAQVTSQWNSSWDVPLPPGSLYGNVGVTEDVSADAQDPAHFHQAAFFSSSDGLELQMLEFQSPAATPVPFTSLTYWPATYSATPAAPSTIDVGSGGAFTALDQLVAITPNRGKIQVFGVTDNTANVYAWTQP